jgi:hypothetical protein
MMLIRVTSLHSVLGAILVLGITTAASAEVVLSNLQSPPGIGSGNGIGQLSPPATTNTIRGQEFFTDATEPGYRLNSVTLHMADALGTPGDFVLELYTAPNSGVASGPLGEFTVASNPVTAGHHTFEFADNVILAPSTRYMLVASAPNAAGPGISQYGWRLGSFLGSGNMWGVNAQWVSGNGGASWAPVRSNPLQIAIDATAIPEPTSATFATLAAIAACLTGRFRYR